MNSTLPGLLGSDIQRQLNTALAELDIEVDGLDEAGNPMEVAEESCTRILQRAQEIEVRGPKDTEGITALNTIKKTATRLWNISEAERKMVKRNVDFTYSTAFGALKKASDNAAEKIKAIEKAKAEEVAQQQREREETFNKRRATLEKLGMAYNEIDEVFSFEEVRFSKLFVSVATAEEIKKQLATQLIPAKARKEKELEEIQQQKEAAQEIPEEKKENLKSRLIQRIDIMREIGLEWKDDAYRFGDLFYTSEVIESASDTLFDQWMDGARALIKQSRARMETREKYGPDVVHVDAVPPADPIRELPPITKGMASMRRVLALLNDAYDTLSKEVYEADLKEGAAAAREKVGLVRDDVSALIDRL